MVLMSDDGGYGSKECLRELVKKKGILHLCRRSPGGGEKKVNTETSVGRGADGVRVWQGRHEVGMRRRQSLISGLLETHWSLDVIV